MKSTNISIPGDVIAVLGADAGKKSSALMTAIENIGIEEYIPEIIDVLIWALIEENPAKRRLRTILFLLGTDTYDLLSVDSMEPSDAEKLAQFLASTLDARCTR